MDQFLADFYGTNTKTASPEPEDLEQRAQIELFCKVAASQGIDVSSMPDADVERLFGAFVSKVAEGKKEESEEEEESKGEDAKAKAIREFTDKRTSDGKVAEANREFEQKRAAARDLAQSEFIGRNAAHAYVDELRKIAAEAGAEADEEASDEKRKKEEGAPKKEASSLHTALRRGLDRAQSKTAQATRVAKQASAIDELAMEVAVVKVAEAGLDPHLAAKRIDALFTLEQVGESEKVARAESLEVAVDARALELLEQAGYPVTWAE